MGTLSEDEDEALTRTVHPLIHLGCGVEFNQPVLVLEALALTAIHNKTLDTFLSKAESLGFHWGSQQIKVLPKLSK